MDSDLRTRIRRAILAKSQERLTSVFLDAVFLYKAYDAEKIAIEEMEGMPEDIRHWWLEEECPCTKKELN